MGQRGGIEGNIKNIKLNEKTTYQNMRDKPVTVFRGTFIALNAYIRNKKVSN